MQLRALLPRFIRTRIKKHVSLVVTLLPYKIRNNIIAMTLTEAAEKRIDLVSDRKFYISSSCSENLKKNLKKTGLLLDGLPSGFVKEFFSFVTGHVSNSGSIEKELRTQILATPAEALSAEDWIGLYGVACRSGVYRLALPFRDKALRSVLIQGSDYVCKKKYIAAAIELEEIRGEELERLICDSNLPQVDKDLFLSHSLFSGLLFKDSAVSLHDPGFYDHTNGKTLAIVGPSKYDATYAHEIDAHDEIVRLNYQISGKGCDPDKTGEKTTISYFNGEQGNVLVGEGRGELPCELSYACFKSSRAALQASGINPSVRCREFINFNPTLFNGTLNLGPLTILDVLLHEAAEVKLYFMDLMLTVDRFSGYYPAAFNRDDSNALVRTFNIGMVNHDPVTQYRLLERLWRAKKIDGDKRFNEVMQLGCGEYMNQLQNKYSVIH